MVYGLSPAMLGQAYVRDGKWKYITETQATHEQILTRVLQAPAEPELVARIPLGEQLYDLEADPGETRNAVKDYPAGRDRLRREVTLWCEASLARVKKRGAGASRPPELSAEEEARLRSLGYGPPARGPGR